MVLQNTVFQNPMIGDAQGVENLKSVRSEAVYCQGNFTVAPDFLFNAATIFSILSFEAK
jgi:hypothetical protein